MTVPMNLFREAVLSIKAEELQLEQSLELKVASWGASFAQNALNREQTRTMRYLQKLGWSANQITEWKAWEG